MFHPVGIRAGRRTFKSSSRLTESFAMTFKAYTPTRSDAVPVRPYPIWITALVMAALCAASFGGGRILHAALYLNS
jgi:hypothetical protein